MKKHTNQHDPQGRPHGLWEDYWTNGNLFWRGHYHHGKPHGLWENYRPNGTLSFKRYHLLIR